MVTQVETLLAPVQPNPFSGHFVKRRTAATLLSVEGTPHQCEGRGHRVHFYRLLSLTDRCFEVPTVARR
jgi:hypothetical protein